MFEPRVEQLRRDLRAVWSGFRGERAPPWLPRDGSRYADIPARTCAQTALAARELVVVEVVRETADAVSLVLASPSGEALPLARPGQFLTLVVDIDGRESRRAYSISSDCRARERLSVTVKRVVGGRVSPYLVEQAKPGLRLGVLGPSGEFGCTPEPGRSDPRKLILIAGGSGITPMMAMLRTLLPSEPNTEIALLYANRSWPETIFAAELAALEARHGPRLRVLHTLERPPEEPGERDGSGFVGRATPTQLATMLEQLTPLVEDPATTFMLCGPQPMMDGADELLRGRGVDPARIRRESFVAPHLRDEDRDALRQRGPQPLTIVTEAGATELVAAPDQTLLEVGLAAGLDMPYSCTMGGCGACKVQLEAGQVVMREPNCLVEDERASGHVLACVARATHPCRIRVPSETS